MVQKVGGELWHMTVISCAQGFKAPGFEAAMLVQFLDAGFIFVDKHGRRVVNEAGQEAHDQHKHFDHFDSEKMEFPIPLWTVFDEQTRRKSPLYRGFSAYNRDLYAWSRDNSAEIAKGWILQGKTAAELAANMSIHPRPLRKRSRGIMSIARPVKMWILGGQKKISGFWSRPSMPFSFGQR